MKARRPFTSMADALGVDPDDRLEVACADCAALVSISRFVYNLGQAVHLSDYEMIYCASCKSKRDMAAQAKRLRIDRRVCLLIQSVKKGENATELQLSWLEKHGYSTAAESIRRVMRERDRRWRDEENW